jgi:hypothetical protein
MVELLYRRLDLRLDSAVGPCPHLMRPKAACPLGSQRTASRNRPYIITAPSRLSNIELDSRQLRVYIRIGAHRTRLPGQGPHAEVVDSSTVKHTRRFKTP